MSLPRAIIPGRCYMITRGCSERRFFMRPNRETNNAFIYCLGLAAPGSRVTNAAPSRSTSVRQYPVAASIGNPTRP